MRYRPSSVVTAYVLSLLPALHAWLNEYDQPALFQCEDGEFLSHIISQHSNQAEDRRWKCQCSPLPVEGDISECQWSDPVNDYDEVASFQCEQNGFITGFSSIHSDKHEDRRFKYQCCFIPGALTKDCNITDWQNAWDGDLDFTVPDTKVLIGMASYHENAYEDRRFKFVYCDVMLR